MGGGQAAALERLLIEPARRKPDRVFLIGGSMYPADFPWSSNIYFIPRAPPADHKAFYCSSDLTLNITRQAMLERGFCPSGRLFEAAACERGRARKIRFVSRGKSGILEYYGDRISEAQTCYVVQLRPAGLCDEVFRALPVIDQDEPVVVCRIPSGSRRTR